MVLLFLAAFVSCTVAGTFALDAWGSRRLRNVLAEARRQNVPITFDDPYFKSFEDKGDVPPEENAVSYYDKALTMLSANTTARIGTLPVIGAGDAPADPKSPIPPEMLDAMREYIDVQREGLSLLHKGGLCTKCVYRGGPESRFAEPGVLSQVRLAMRVVELKIWLDAEEGHPENGAETLTDGLALSSSLIETPSVMGALVGTATHGYSLNGLQRLIARGEPSDETLAMLQRSLTAAAEGLSLRPALIGEVPFVLNRYRDVLSGAMAPSVFLQEAPENTAVEYPGMDYRVTVWLMRGLYKADEAYTMTVFLKAISNASSPSPEAVTKAYWDTLRRETDRSLYFLSRERIAWLAQFAPEGGKWRARLNAATACVAAVRYRRDSAKWPDALDNLVPRYLDAVPVDPFTGKALVYRQTADGIMIYSIGPSVTDDGGKPGLVRPAAADEKKYDDFGFMVWKEEKAAGDKRVAP